jgi:hypothetical protein
MNLSKKERILKSSKDIATGLLTCADCGAIYYFKQQKSEHKKTGWKKYYYSYFHNQGFRLSVCSQFPRSLKIDDINPSVIPRLCRGTPKF